MNPPPPSTTPQALALWEMGGTLVLMVLAVFAVSHWLGRRWPVLQPTTPEATRWIDGLRGLAATLVLLNHGPLVPGYLGVQPLGYAISGPAYDLLIHLGQVGVHIFFCITGFLFAGKLLKAKSVDWTQFFIQRVRRLLPAYLAAAVAALMVLALFLEPGSASLRDVAQAVRAMLAFGFTPLPQVGNVDTADLLGMNWTLAYEWRFYAMLPLLLALIRFAPLASGLGILAVTVTFAFAVGPGVWTFFTIGAMASLASRYQPTPVQRHLLRALLFGVLLSMLLLWPLAFRSKGVQVMQIALLFFTLMLLRPAPLSRIAFVTVGSFSYSLYIFHLLVFYLILGLLHKYALDLGTLTWPAVSVLLIGLSVLISLWSALAYRLVEHPFLRPSGYASQERLQRPTLRERQS